MPLPPEDRPDIDRLATLRPELRLDYTEAVNTVKQAKAEAHQPEQLRRVDPAKLANAEWIVALYARPE